MGVEETAPTQEQLEAEERREREADEQKNKSKNPFEVKDKKEEPKPPKKEEERKDEENKNEFEEKYKRFQPFDTEAFKEVEEVVNSFEGETIDDKIKAFRAKYDGFEDELKQVRQKEEEREAWFRQNKITSSSEWNERYQKPLEKAKEFYVTTLGEVDSEGNPKNEKHFVKLREMIFNEGKEIELPKIKAILQKFSAEYRKAFGEDPDLPSIKAIVDARDEVVAKAVARQKSLDMWEEEQKAQASKAKTKAAEEAQTLREQKKIEISEDTITFAESFDYEPLSGFFEKDKIKETVNSIKEEVVQVISGDKEDINYSQYLDLALKAKLFDDLLSKATKLDLYVKEHKGGKLEDKSEIGDKKKASVGETDKIDFFGKF